MTKEQKNVIIAELSSEFKEATGIVIVEYKGTTVKELEVLRNEARPMGIKVQVVKNKLGTISLKNAGIDGLTLKDTNLLVWGNDVAELSKLAVKYAAQYDKRFILKSGAIDGKIVDGAGVDAISKLPSKPEMIAMLLSLWMTPARMFVTVLSAPGRDFVCVLDAIKRKKEEG